MSTTSPNEILNSSDWGIIPTDILLAIFEKLDSKSIFNSMCVNRYWKSVGIYYCNHYKKWRKLVEVSTNNKSSIFKEKSKLRNKNVVLNALQWYSVKCATVHLSHRYDFENVKNICVYNDDLMVVTNYGVEYYDIDTHLWQKTVDSSSVQFIETASIIAEFTPIEEHRPEYNNKLTVTNKLHYRNCKCLKPLTETFYNVLLWKVSFKHVYIMNSTTILRWYSIRKCTLMEHISLFNMNHNQDFVCGWQIKKGTIYILKKDFTILYTGRCGYEYRNVYKFNIPSYYLDTKPYMFNTYSAICAVPREENFKIHIKEDGKELVVACPGFTCATEHGHMVLVGYENGKIQIFRTAHLLEKSETPELEFNLQSYTKSLTNKIIALDVHESKDCLSIFAATKFNVYHFIISEN